MKETGGDAFLSICIRPRVQIDKKKKTIIHFKILLLSSSSCLTFYSRWRRVWCCEWLPAATPGLTQATRRMLRSSCHRSREELGSLASLGYWHYTAWVWRLSREGDRERRTSWWYRRDRQPFEHSVPVDSQYYLFCYLAWQVWFFSAVFSGHSVWKLKMIILQYVVTIVIKNEMYFPGHA